MKALTLVLIFLLILTNTIWAKNLVFLTTGVPYKLPVSPQNKIWIQNKNILDAKDYGNYLIVQGKSSGTSKVHIGEKQYTFAIGSKDQNESYKRLLASIRFSKNLSLDYESGIFIVYGTIKEASEWKTLRALNIINWQLKADIENPIVANIQRELNNELAKKNAPEVEIYSSPFMSVRLEKTYIRTNPRALEIIKMWGIKIETDNDIITPKALIKVKMTLVELRKSSFSEIGISPPNQLSAQLGSNGSITDGKWTSPINLNLLSSKGIAQVLATPVLLTKSGSEAEFLAGGEIPIRIFNNKSKEVIWKKYGINLKVKPTADNYGHIKMDIETEVSDIDAKRSVDGIPAMITNRIQSHFELQRSQTLILSGLIKHKNGETVTGWPWLKEIPILGSLFSSNDFQQEKTEMLILVTPEIVKN